MWASLLPKGRTASLCLWAALASAWAGDLRPDLDVPADSRAVPALRRLQARSGIPLPSQSLPIRESAAWSRADSSGTRADRMQMEAWLHGRHREPVRWEDSARGHSFYLSPFLDAGYAAIDHRDSSETRLLTGVGMTVSGKLFPRLAYYGRGAVYTEFTDRAQFTHQFNPDFGETYSVEKGADDSLLSDRTFNRFEHYVLLDLPWVTLKAGRDRIHAGPGYFSSLMATRETPPYYQIAARVDFAPWLSVDDYLLRMTDTDHDILKYANLHRFEFRPGYGLSIAFQDIVIYQDRDPDWRYVLPLTPLAFSEDNTGGGDNDGMGFDFHWCGVRNLSVWGEVFIDDLLGPGAFFDSFWENRWATLAGFQIVSPFPAVDADLVVEYSRVEPWTYTGRASQTSFKHFNAHSASKLGPDSRSWDIQASWRPLAWLEVAEHMEFNDKGTQRGAQLGLQHRDGIDPDTKEFLAGNVIEERAFTHRIDALWGPWLSARAYWTQRFGTQAFGSTPPDVAGVETRIRW